MKKIERTFIVENKKNKNHLGEALSEWYGKPISGKGSLHWMTYKYGRARLERAFDLAQKENDHTFINLMQRIHHS